MAKKTAKKKTGNKKTAMKILNVGCGKDTYGTHFVDLYPSRKDVVRGDINVGLPFKDNTFDEVYNNNFFEHLRNPHQSLMEMKRILKPGGKIRIMTDNASYWIFALNNTAHTGGYESKEHPGDCHYMLFTPTHFENFAKAAGLEVVKIDYVNEQAVLKFPKNAVRAIVNGTLRISPLRRMGYACLNVTLRKPKINS